MNDGDVRLQGVSRAYSDVAVTLAVLVSLMRAREMTADRQKNSRATERLALGMRHSATVIDLAAWRARHARQAFSPEDDGPEFGAAIRP